MKILSVVGARPNFMKIAPIISAIDAHNLRCAGSLERMDHVLVHTGQHYDSALSERFFADLELPAPGIFLGVGSGSHAVQTGNIMRGFEEVALREEPDLIIVIGDVNSTIACALVASKLSFGRGVRPLIAHVEAGLRSFDRSMPEEINRVLTDHISDILFVTEDSGVKNLINEGIGRDRIHFAGNTMIDTLVKFRTKASRSAILKRLGLVGDGGAAVPYALLTLHRPSNVDNAQAFSEILAGIEDASLQMPVIFPAHPRTRKRIDEFGLSGRFSLPEDAETAKARGPVIVDPLGYLDFLCMMMNSAIVLTDSGGVQEETTCLGVPCVTLRDNTERPVTVTEGTNVIAGTTRGAIARAIREQFSAKTESRVPQKWDGASAQRMVEVIAAQQSPKKDARCANTF